MTTNPPRYSDRCTDRYSGRYILTLCSPKGREVKLKQKLKRTRREDEGRFAPLQDMAEFAWHTYVGSAQVSREMHAMRVAR